MSIYNSFTAELIKLRNIENSLETSQVQFIQECCTKDPSLPEFIAKLNADRNTTCNLNEILTLRQQMQDLLCKMSNEKSISTDTMKSDLINIKEIIQGLKVKCKTRLDELKEEETVLLEEITAFETKFSEWTKPITSEEPLVNNHNMNNKQLGPEIKDYNKLLYMKTHLNGWTANDHTIFLKMKERFKNVNKLAEKLHAVFPDKTIEQIKDHYIWHEQYLELENKNKEAIHEWKQKKQTSNEVTKSDTNIERKQCIVLPESVHETKAKLAAWKEAKKRRKEQEIVVKEKNYQFQKQLELIKLEKNAEIKEKVESWRAIREAEKHAIEAKRREEELRTRTYKAMLANRFIREFQVQDQRFVKRMQSTKVDKRKAVTSKPNSGKDIVDRDPLRIFKPTQNWIFKTRKMKGEESMAIGLGYCNLNLNNIPKLKFPDWRK